MKNGDLSRIELGSFFNISAECTAITVGNTEGVCLPAARQFEEHLKSQ